MKELEDLEATGTIKLIPPGFWIFVCINLLFLSSIVILTFNVGISFGVSGENLFIFSTVLSLSLCFIFTTVAFLIIKGFPKFVNALKIFVLTIFVITIAQVFIFSLNIGSISNILLILLTTTNLYLVYSRPFKVFYSYSAKVREIKLEEYEEYKKELQKYKSKF